MRSKGIMHAAFEMNFQVRKLAKLWFHTQSRDRGTVFRGLCHLNSKRKAA